MNMNVLFADDQMFVRESVTLNLENLGHIVEVVTDGDEIIKSLNAGNRPDMIITDGNMERMGGMEVLWRLRGDPRFMNLPIIVYSGDECLKIAVEKLSGVFVYKAGTTDSLAKLFAAIDAIKASIEEKEGG